MKRTIALALAILLLCLSMAGCNENTEPTQPQTQPSAVFDGSLEVGDTIPDLTVTTAAGKTISLQQLLQKKKLVVLNFWFADCIWCLREFPAMEVAYQSCKSDVEILALNPIDSSAAVADFQKEKSLSFPMATCSRDLTLAFGINGYPTSVFIDRNGTVCLIHSGAITDVSTFRDAFNAFTAEDYTTTLYPEGIQSLLG